MPFDLTPLEIFYLFLLVVGVLYALFSLLAGMDFDLPFDIPGMDGAADAGLAHISPISIAAFITAFGAIGIIATRGLGLDATTSIIYAVVGSILVALVAHAVFYFIFVAPQASSAVKQGDLIGLTAEVTAPIPATSVGEITYVAMGSRQTAQARSTNGEAIPRGATVVVESITGTVLNVRRK
jgi:membrane protein implicated in regulation of membrane protease activity